MVTLWVSPPPLINPGSAPAMLKSIKIVAWNCRGLSQAIPYIQLLAEVHDVIVLSEHWLGCGNGNAQGILLQELINQASLYPVSMSALTTGPMYTYSHAGNFTTVDYCLTDQSLAYATSYC